MDNNKMFSMIISSKYFLRNNAATRMILTLVILLQISAVCGQNNPLPAIKGAFSDFSVHRVVEKLFVHTDKKFYVAGEIVWFKIYEVAGSDNRPADLSKVAYVEL